MQMSQLMYLLALFGAVQLQGCGGGEEEVDPTPDPHDDHDHDDHIVTVSSELTFDGMTEEQAKAIEPAIVTGIAATIEGVSDDDVTITGYSRRLSGRSLADSVKIAFEIVVPEGVEADAVSGGITEAAADATAVLEAITAAVEADADLKAAFADLGGDLSAVTLTVAEPVVKETPKEETPAPTTKAPTTPAPTTKAPTTVAPTTAEPVNGTNSSRRLEFAFTTNELIA